MTLITLIMRLYLRPAPEVLHVPWMHDRPLNRNNYRLLHPVTDHYTGSLFSKPSLIHTAPFPPWSAFSRRMVSTLARSRFVCPNFIGFSSLLVARFSFRCPISSRSSVRLCDRSSILMSRSSLASMRESSSLDKNGRNRQFVRS